MSRRTFRIGLAVAAAAALLFLGREVTGLLAERWWAAQVLPPSADFLTRQRLLALLLEIVGSTLAATWFIGNYFFVYRAIGSVQVPRQVANLEITETLTPRVLIMFALGAGLLLGVIAGSGMGEMWSSAMLAWEGVRWSVSDPLLQRDIGVYVSQLPLWRGLHSFAFLLVLLGFGTVLFLYVLVGALRWHGGRPAITDHARRHIGWLLAALALTLAWGYALEPYEIVAGLKGGTDGAVLRFLIARVLTGTALAAALVATIWAWQPRHGLMVSAWLLLVTGSIAGHHIIPALRANAGEEEFAEERHELEALAFALSGIADTLWRQPRHPPAPPPHPLLWHRSAIASLAGADSAGVLAVNRASLPIRHDLFPIWMLLRESTEGGATVLAIADDRTTSRGAALAYRPGDSIPYPGLPVFLEIPTGSIRPNARAYRIHEGTSGVRVGGPARRLVLAWALQAGELFTGIPSTARVEWHLAPKGRLESLAPWLTWSPPTAHLVDDELYWLSTGLLTTRTFPMVRRVSWNGKRVASVHPGFIGAINAETGETRFYLGRNADPLARAWARLANGMIELPTSMPPEMEEILPYPEELFDLQSRVLGSRGWIEGHLVGAGDESEVQVGSAAWKESAGARQVAAYDDPGERRLTDIVEAAMRKGWQRVEITRLAVEPALPSPEVLDRSWRRFPSYEQLRDSLRAAGSRLHAGPVQFWQDGTGVGAYRAEFAISADGLVNLVWVSIALGDRLGAGHDPREAWRNLEGLSVPILPGGTPGELEEARRYLERADSALRRGDWVGFARAYEALREILSQRPK